MTSKVQLVCCIIRTTIYKIKYESKMFYKSVVVLYYLIPHECKFVHNIINNIICIYCVYYYCY